MSVDASNPPLSAHDDPALSLPKAFGALFADLPGLLSDRVHLLSLELQRASSALGQMVALGLLASVLFATAWLALWVGLAAGFIALGLAWWWAAALVMFINLAAAVWALLRVKALAPLLALPATLRRLTDSDSLERHDEHHVDPAQSAP